MKRLALETATTATAVGLDDGTGTLLEEVVDTERRHTESLAPAAERLLAASGLAPSALEEVVVDVGPGLFTGLRVGIAFATGLALAAGVELRAVTSTDVLAHAAADCGAGGAIVAVVDARRGEVFAARYVRDETGLARRGEIELLAPSALRGRLAAEPATLVGDGAMRYRDVLDGADLVELAVPPPAVALRLAERARTSGEPALPPEDLHPLYLREADAVANFAVRTGRRP